MGFFVSEMMGRFMSIQYYRMAISKRIIMICMMCYSSLYTESMNAKLREFYQISGDSLAILKAPEEKKPKPSLFYNTFSVHSGLGSARGIGFFGFSKDLLFTENIGVYFSMGIGTPVSWTHKTYGVGTFFQSHYNDNGWNIAALFGMAPIGGQSLTGLIYYQYRIGKRGLVSVGLLQGAFLHSKPAGYWAKYFKDPNFPPGRYSYTFPIISYDFLFL